MQPMSMGRFNEKYAVIGQYPMISSKFPLKSGGALLSDSRGTDVIDVNKNGEIDTYKDPKCVAPDIIEPMLIKPFGVVKDYIDAFKDTGAEVATQDMLEDTGVYYGKKAAFFENSSTYTLYNKDVPIISFKDLAKLLVPGIMGPVFWGFTKDSFIVYQPREEEVATTTKD